MVYGPLLACSILIGHMASYPLGFFGWPYFMARVRLSTSKKFRVIDRALTVHISGKDLLCGWGLGLVAKLSFKAHSGGYKVTDQRMDGLLMPQALIIFPLLASFLSGLSLISNLMTIAASISIPTTAFSSRHSVSYTTLYATPCAPPFTISLPLITYQG